MVSINDAAYGNGNGQTTNTVSATALGTIGNKTGGTVTTLNAIRITGTATQVTDALVTDNSKVIASPDNTVAVVSTSVSQNKAGFTNINNVNALFTSGVEDSIDNLTSSDTQISTNLSTITNFDTNFKLP